MPQHTITTVKVSNSKTMILSNSKPGVTTQVAQVLQEHERSVV